MAHDTLSQIRDLETYGIQYLTSESCAYSLRMLFDLNQDGIDLITEFFGGNIRFTEKSNWNPRVNGTEALASILLMRSTVRDLMVFLLARQFDYVAECNDGFVGMDEHDYDKYYKNVLDKTDGFCIIKHPPFNPGGVKNGRNVHAMTGRTT